MKAERQKLQRRLSLVFSSSESSRRTLLSPQIPVVNLTYTHLFVQCSSVFRYDDDSNFVVAVCSTF